MLNKIPTISVIMSVYNGEQYLEDAINSMLCQTASDFEFIVIDDGSTDGTTKLLQQYRSSDDRIQVLHHANVGLTASLNIGIRQARGEFIARMDSDDRADPYRLEAQLAYLRKHSECVALGSRLRLIDPDGDSLGDSQPPVQHDDIVESLYQGIGSLPHPSVLMRRTAVESVGGYRESFRYAQDLDLWLRLAEIGQLANLTEPLLNYRLHLNSITNEKRREQLECARRAVREACLRSGRPSIPITFAEQKFSSSSRVYRGWAGLASSNGYADTARKHAWNAFKENPYTTSHIGVVAKLVSATFRGSKTKAKRAA